MRATGGAVSAEDREEGTFDDDEALSSADATRRDAPRQRLRMGSGGCGEVHTARLSEHQGMRARARPRAQEARTQRLWSFATRHVRSVGVPPSVKRRFRGGTRRHPFVARTVTLARVRHTPPPVVAMNEIMNHGYVAPPARARDGGGPSSRVRERPYIVGELTGEFDPFNDFPLPVAARTTPTTPRSAASSTAASRLPSRTSAATKSSATTSRASATTNPPPLASQTTRPRPAPPRPLGNPLLPRPRTHPDHHHPGQWQTTAQAQMSGRRRPASTIRQAHGPSPGRTDRVPMARGADGSFGASEHAYGRVGFGPNRRPSPLARTCCTGTWTRGGAAVQRRFLSCRVRWSRPGDAGELRGGGEAGLAQRAPKDLLVENFNPRCRVHQGVGSAAVLSSDGRKKREGKGGGNRE